MGAMYKIVRYIPQGTGILGGSINGAKKYHGIKAAKFAMYETVKNKFAGMEKKCASLIDSYCKEHYPDGAPKNFDLLKQFINEYLKDPETFDADFENKYADIDFEDEQVCFGLSFDFTSEGINPYLYIDVSEEAKWKFPEGVIASISLPELTDYESERYILLTAGEHIGLEIVFSLMTDEDEDNYPWEDWD